MSAERFFAKGDDKMNRRTWIQLGWALPLFTVAGFSMAIPARQSALRIEDLSLTEETSSPFDRSMREGLMEASELLDARGNIDVVTPNTVVNNTNIDVVTPNTVVNNTNIDVVTPNTVVNNTNIDVVTPNTVINNTNITVNPFSASRPDESGGVLSFFPQRAKLPSPAISAALADEASHEN